MDRKRRNIIAVGALTVSAAVLFVWGMYYLLGNPILRGGLDVTVLVEDAAGIKRGDRVFIQGVDIGWVREIDLNRNNTVTISARLRGDLALPEDTRASVLGDVFGAHTVQLQAGNSPTVLEDGDTIRGSAVPPITALAADISEQAMRILGRTDSLLSPALVENVQQTVASLPAGAQEMQAAMREFRQAVATLNRTIASVEVAETSEAVNRALAEVERSATALTATTGTLERTLVNMDRSIVTMGSVMTKIDRGQGTLGKLVNDSTLYVELNLMLREMGALATDLRERPSRYINLRIF
jgi:phospholipid/cholesterol/gamma-HCH transport system substrate-binding protein